jgi:DnaJ-class molecular chaperone
MKCKACEGTGKFEINEKNIQYTNTCYLCDGIGEIVICKSCNGQGEIISNYRFTPCMMCRGNGYSPKVTYDCKLCEGDGILYTYTPNPYLEDFDVCKEPCDCTIEELMNNEQGKKTKYFYEIHNVRRKHNGF